MNVHLKSLLWDLAKTSPLLRVCMRKVQYVVMRVVYIWQGHGQPIDARTVVFQSFDGRNYSDSPRAIYERIVERQIPFRCVWAFNYPENYSFLSEQSNTIVVRKGSKEYHRWMARAKYWVFNYRALDYLEPKTQQCYIQCWHGTPLKRLGYDIDAPGNVMNSLSEIRQKYKSDAERMSFLLSSCRFASEIFASAWNLNALQKEDIVVELGYPRNDFLATCSAEDSKKIKLRLGIDKDPRKVILYAPTWRDDQHSSCLGYVHTPEINLDFLQAQLQDDYLILFRSHYLVSNHLSFDRYSGFVYDVSSWDDIRELYVISDCLITDYSSVFFDYAILGRPIIFFMYDLERYRDELRGFYLSLDDLPGPVVNNETALVEVLLGSTKVNREAVASFNQKFNYMNDGLASDRFIERCLQYEHGPRPQSNPDSESGPLV